MRIDASTMPTEWRGKIDVYFNGNLCDGSDISMADDSTGEAEFFVKVDGQLVLNDEKTEIKTEIKHGDVVIVNHYTERTKNEKP